MGKAANILTAEATIKLLSEALDETIKMYESGAGKKMDPVLISVLKEFVKRHAPLLVQAALGNIKLSQARDILVGLVDTTGTALSSKWIDCGVALFELGVTGMEWTSNTLKVARVSSFAAATGVGVPAATAATVVVALFGVMMTTKDAIDAAEKCNQAISSKASFERRPVAVVNKSGYNLGQLSIGLYSSPSYGVSMVR